MPLLLIDVDGVLMPLGRSVPPGFERHTTPTSDIVASSRHGEWLHALRVSYEIVWATTWGDAANDTFGKLFGLPRFDHVNLRDLPRAGTRKLAAVAKYAKGRALAWVDDELFEDAREWAKTRLEPTLLVCPAPYVGLTPAHFDDLERFASESAATTSP